MLSMQIGSNLKFIRENTGLSQADFYTKYLEKLELITPRNSNSVISAATKQDWMKKLESGKMSKVPLEIFSVYADIGNISIDEIFGYEANNKTDENKKQIKTYADLFRILFEVSHIPLINYVKSNFGSSRSSITGSFVFEDETVATIFSTWEKLINMAVNDKTMLPIVKTWQEGVLKEYSNEKMKCPFMDIPDELPFN